MGVLVVGVAALVLVCVGSPALQAGGGIVLALLLILVIGGAVHPVATRQSSDEGR